MNSKTQITFFLSLPSPLGTLHLESDGEALTCVLFEGEQAKHPQGVTLEEAPQLPVFVAAFRLAAFAHHSIRFHHHLWRFGRVPSSA